MAKQLAERIFWTRTFILLNNHSKGPRNEMVFWMLSWSIATSTTLIRNSAMAVHIIVVLERCCLLRSPARHLPLGTCNHRGAVVFIPLSSRRIGASGVATLSHPPVGFMQAREHMFICDGSTTLIKL